MKYFLPLIIFLIQLSSCENKPKKTPILEEDVYTLEKVIQDVALDLIERGNYGSRKLTPHTDFSNNTMVYYDSTYLDEDAKNPKYYFGSDNDCFANIGLDDTAQQRGIYIDFIKQDEKKPIQLKDSNIRFIKLLSVFKSNYPRFTKENAKDYRSFWASLYDNYKVNDVFSFSDVGFSPDGKFAMVFYTHNSSGGIFLAELKENKWVYSKGCGFWID